MEVLRRHCDDLGRDYDEIERYCGLDLQAPGAPKGQLAESSLVLERSARLEEAGSQGVFIVLPRLADSDSIERFGREVIGQAG